MITKNLTAPGFLACLFFSLIMVSGILNVFAQCPSLIWQDEFNGTSLDLTKWEQMLGTGTDYGLQPGWGNNELQFYRAENTTVANGLLTITAKKENYRGSAYTSSRIRTLNKGDWTYGRFEARMKLPYSQGLWPAFWMLPTDNFYGGWPTSGEIDIMELVGTESHKVHGTIHYGDAWPNNQNQGNSYALHSGLFKDAFHEFAIEWEPGIIRWYVDGYLYSTKRNTDVAPYLWPFDKNFHFLLNVAVGGNWPGNPDNTSVFPQQMVVDYVRVYGGNRPAITGNRTVAYQATGQIYSIANAGQGASYTWSVPAGATIVSGQGTASVTVNFGATSGNVTATVGTSCGTTQLSADVFVEPSYQKDFSFLNFDDPDNVTFNSTSGNYSPDIANPSASGVNTSALSARYVRNSAEQYDVLVYNETSLANGDEYVNGNRKFYLDVYTSAPVGTQILLQLENSNATATNFPTGRHSRYVATCTVRNQWERLTFKLLDRPDGAAAGTSVNKIIFLFASNTFTGDTYYFDNFDSYKVQSSSDTQAPTAPTNLQTSNITSSSVSLAWTASTDNVGVTGYDIYVNNNLSGNTAGLSFNVNGLAPSTAYNFTVKAKDAAGNVSASSNVATATTLAIPTSVKVEAENYIAQKGVLTETCSDTGGGLNVTSIDSRDYMDYSINVPSAGTYRVDFRVASAVATGKIEFKKGQSILTTLSVPNTGGSQVWQTISGNATLAAGTQTFRVNAKSGTFNLNWLEIAPAGTSSASFEFREISHDGLNLMDVYPNPAQGYVTVKSNTGEKIRSIDVISSTGSVRSIQTDAATIQLSTSDWGRGLFVLKARTNTSGQILKVFVE